MTLAEKQFSVVLFYLNFSYYFSSQLRTFSFYLILYNRFVWVYLGKHAVSRIKENFVLTFKTGADFSLFCRLLSLLFIRRAREFMSLLQESKLRKELFANLTEVKQGIFEKKNVFAFHGQQSQYQTLKRETLFEMDVNKQDIRTWLNYLIALAGRPAHPMISQFLPPVQTLVAPKQRKSDVHVTISAKEC